MSTPTYATGIQFLPDVEGVPVSAGTASGQRLYYDGADAFSKYLALVQVQAELSEIGHVERPDFFAQSADDPTLLPTPAALVTWIQAHPSATISDVIDHIGSGVRPDLRDVARKVAWDCWVDRLVAHTPPAAPPTPPPPPTPISAPDVSGP